MVKSVELEASLPTTRYVVGDYVVLSMPESSFLGDLIGDGIVVSPPPPIIERLYNRTVPGIYTVPPLPVAGLPEKRHI